MSAVFITVPPPRALSGATTPSGTPLDYSFEAFVYEYVFSRVDGEQIVAHPAWRASAEWVASYLRAAPLFTSLDGVPYVEVEEEDVARMWSVLQGATIPHRVHLDVMPYVLAIATPSRERPPYLVEAPAAVPAAPVAHGGDEPFDPFSPPA